jgi:TonB family protein
MKELFKSRLISSVVIAVVFLFAGFAYASAQQTRAPDETARAVALFQQGRNDEAIQGLRAAVERNKFDLRAWHYLGLALEKKGDLNESAKAHEIVARLGDDLLTNALDQNKSDEEIIKDVTLIKDPLTLAALSGERYVALYPKLSEARRQEWEIRNYSLHGFANIATNPEIITVYRSTDRHEKPRILTHPNPSYTEEARNHGISGTVVLKVVFGVNGRVIRIHAIQGLPYGLIENAIEAARNTKFIPARRDGKPVSAYGQVEYTFTRY